MVFQGKSLFRFLNSKHKDQAVSKNTYYRFLSEISYNWKKFLFLLAVRATAAFQKGFTLLTLGWSDGYSFVPVGFNMLSSGTKSNQYQEMTTSIDCRSNGYKAGKERLMAKTDAAILMIKRALNVGIRADYVLMDTWFTTEPMIRSILAEELDVIGMVKQLKQWYRYKGSSYTLPELQKFVSFDGATNIFGSLCVTTKNGIPVKIVFVRNCNKKIECLYLLRIDCGLSDAESKYPNRL